MGLRLLQRWSQRLPEVWRSRGLVAWALRPVAFIYGQLVAVRRWAYALGLFKSSKVPALVIVVGNVVAGGAGKTPVTMALVRHLSQQGLRVGVISRGYGRKTQDTRAVSVASLPMEVGDEPLLIHQSTGVPVWVGRQRVQAALGLLAAHPEVQILICDDGLQHLALARDIEICVMDERGIGNTWLLPAGPLREPWPRAVDWVLHTGPSGLGGGFQAHRQLGLQAIASDGHTVALSSLKNQRLNAVAGLARPQAFFEMLRQAGLTLDTTLALPDHHDFQDWAARQNEGIWLCTEKDAAKLWPFEPKALAVPLVISPEKAFWAALDARLVQMGSGPHTGKGTSSSPDL